MIIYSVTITQLAYITCKTLHKSLYTAYPIVYQHMKNQTKITRAPLGNPVSATGPGIERVSPPVILMILPTVRAETSP